ncbi:MAG: PAS domain-containing protein [Actinobacteria bacterium]|nr:PAS domain-containing protein [Actinomycetota bacterium]
MFNREILRLERALLASQDDLRSSVAELQAANEELEASSEELQAASEELQATNEELQASNEELQATNDELGAVNREQQTRSDALQELNTDLDNIQTSFTQGMVIVDRDLRITRFSSLAVRVFALIPDDIGTLLSRPFTPSPRASLVERWRSVTMTCRSSCRSCRTRSRTAADGVRS